MPLRVAAATSVWFLAAPFVLPLFVVLSTGLLAAAILFGCAAVRYLKLAPRTRYIGIIVIGAGMLFLCGSSAAGAGVALELFWSVEAFDRLLAFNLIVNMFIALGMHVLVFEDMTEELRRANRDLVHAHQEVKRLVITDPLTGCHNRRFLDEIERREIQRHRRYEAPLSVVFVDVNHFKRLNDTLGHDVGDKVLKAIGELLRRHVRESDYVIRWGGDEFLLLLTCTAAEAQRKADDLKAAFELQRQEADLPEGIGLSTGVAGVPPDAENLADTIRAADSRMYCEKLADRVES
jgi:diguanylate cyclase (GGDEF)-like protein